MLITIEFIYKHQPVGSNARFRELNFAERNDPLDFVSDWGLDSFESLLISISATFSSSMDIATDSLLVDCAVVSISTFVVLPSNYV